MKTRERFEWAVEMLDIKPDDKILEIGCGAGLAVELVAGKLGGGSITAIDRSEAMIKLASNRNSQYIASKKAKLVTGEFSNLRFDAHSFNKIFAFNVGSLLKNNKNEFNTVRSWLTTDGKLYIFYQPPFEKTTQIAKEVNEQLKENNFRIVETVFRKLNPASAFCIVAKP